MEHIKKIYPPEVISELSKSKKHEGFIHALTSENEAEALYRCELNKWLGAGLELEIIDNEKMSRLRGPNSDQRLQTIQELMAIYYFKDVLGFSLTPNPGGKGQRVGEFEATLPGIEKPVFCEVKTPIRETPLGGVWSGNDADAIRSVLEQAYQQVPEDERPSIVILTAKLRSPVSSQMYSVTEALYGKPILIGEFNPERGCVKGFEASHIRNGFFQPKLHRNLSAVITLEDWLGSPRLDSIMKAKTKEDVEWSLPMSNFNYISRIYHNPYALKKIPLEVFKYFKQFSFDYSLRKILEFVES